MSGIGFHGFLKTLKTEIASDLYWTRSYTKARTSNMSDIVKSLRDISYRIGDLQVISGDDADTIDEALGLIERLRAERDKALEQVGAIRVCVNCGKTVPESHPRHEPLSECVGPEGLSACTFDTTPMEAFYHWQEQYYKVCAEHDEARAEVEKLREALRPFARVSEIMDARDNDDLVYDGGGLESECVRVEAFRRARAALEGK